MSSEAPNFVRPPPYDKVVHERIQMTLGNWKPHVLTQEEFDDIRNECRRRRQYLVEFEARADGVPPHEYQRILWASRLDHDIRYYRIFRVNDLPPEILSNILRFVVWSAPEPSFGILWRLQLTWVCRHWRYIAINDPTLWNAIWFRDQPPFERSLTFVQRSRNSAMDIRINDNPREPYTYEEVEQLLDRLTPVVSNIRMLIVLFTEWNSILSILRWLDRWGPRVPLAMERLEIHRLGSPYQWPSHNWMPSMHTVSLYPLFGGKYIPSLTYITLNALHVDWDNTSFENLTTLDIRRIPLELCPTMTRFREMLASCPKLDKLSIDGAGPSDRPNARHDKEPILLSSLRTLVLANFTVQFLHSIITHIAAPNVRDLTLMNFVTVDYTPFYAYITNKFPQVRLLTLYTVQCKAEGIDAVIDCLDSFPHLTYLRIAGLEKDFLGLFLYDVVTKEPHPELSEPVKTDVFEMRLQNPLRTSSSTTSALDPASALISTSSSSSTSTTISATSSNSSVDDSDAESTSDNDTDESTTPAPQIAPRAVGPCANVIEVQRIDALLFTSWVEARKRVGVPVAKVYMTGEMCKQLRDAEMFKRCQEAIEDIQVVSLGSKTVEEDLLLEWD
ncbi:hypothetical protein VKT23_005391 [Stygiomarasmius scandens]|uniref:F-box domain-containing protein n=1 Tax=Marasmiellus scandens TaxID=2682957 RepID=A0ABR1JPW9_9AGAR